MPTPGLARSSQVLMPLGLPLLTTMTTIDCVQMPLVSLSFQSFGDDALVDQAGHVGLQREVDLVGLLAGDDGAALVAGGAVRALELDVLAGVGVVEGVDDALVCLLENGVANDVDGVATVASLTSHSSTPSRPAPRQPRGPPQP